MLCKKISEEFKIAARDFVTEKFRKINSDYIIEKDSIGKGI